MPNETLKLNLTAEQRLQAEAAIAAWRPRLELIRKNPRPRAGVCPQCNGAGCMWCNGTGQV